MALSYSMRRRPGCLRGISQQQFSKSTSGTSRCQALLREQTRSYLSFTSMPRILKPNYSGGTYKPEFVASSRCYSTKSPLAGTQISNFAFAFDIDGVLLRSSKALPGAIKALKFLQAHKIPFILLTNGGGKHETDRVKELSKKFGVELSVKNFVQSHTPFQEMAVGSENYEALADKTVLVTGGDQDKCREIAEQYGFKTVVTPGDILMAQPAIWPFNAIWTDYYAKIARPLPKPVNLSDPANSLRFDAIFIFNDPRDWGLDTQIILDLLLSKNGILGTYSDKNGDTSLPNNGWQQDNQPCLIYSNPDLFWASSYNMPRLGQGGFRSALDGVWAETTDGATLSKLVIGKPYAETYNYAERVLQAHRNSLLAGQDESSPVTLERVFMVGDNPESDIRGANMFESPNGTKWDSILVKTGVYRDGTVPKYEPKALVDDVLSAVKWALVKQGYEHQDKDFVINALEELV